MVLTHEATFRRVINDEVAESYKKIKLREFLLEKGFRPEDMPVLSRKLLKHISMSIFVPHLSRF